MGPLELADFIGLDTCLSVMQVLYEGLAELQVPPLPAAGKIRRGRLARLARPNAAFTTTRGKAHTDALSGGCCGAWVAAHAIVPLHPDGPAR